MKTRVTSALLMLIMMASMSASIALAADTGQPSTDPVEQTQNQIRVMNSGIGAQVRIMQLEKAIQIRIQVGNMVAARIRENGGNATELESITAELQLVLDEVQAADTTAADAAQQFVDLKNDSLQLTQQFREKARLMLNATDQEQLREQARETKMTMNQEANEIRARIREYNREKLTEIQNQHKLQLGEIIQKIQSGEINTSKAKEMVQTQIREMAKEQIKNNFTAIKEQALQKAIQVKQQLEAINQGSLDRLVIRVRNRINNMEGIGEQLQQIIQERMNQTITPNQTCTTGQCGSGDQGGNSP